MQLVLQINKLSSRLEGIGVKEKNVEQKRRMRCCGDGEQYVVLSKRVSVGLIEEVPPDHRPKGGEDIN